MKQRRRIALQLGVSAAMLGVLLSQLDWSRSLELIRNADARWLAVVLALQISDRVLMAVKWHQLLALVDSRLSRASAIGVYYESAFVGFALPLGGLGPDIVRFFRLREHGIARHVTLSSMIMERLIGLLATLMLVVLAFMILARLATEPAWRTFATLAGLIGVIGALGVAVALFHRGAMRIASRLLRPITLPARIQLDKYREAARIYAGRRPVIAGNLLMSLTEQCLPVLAYWAGSRALGTPLPLLICLAVGPVTAIIQRLPFSYAGLGLREGGAAAVLVALGYNYSDALVLSMTLFVVFLFALLPGAVIMITRGPPRLEPVVEQEPR